MGFLTFSAYLAAIICLAGSLYRLLRWCALSMGPESRGDMGRRVTAALAAIAGAMRPDRFRALVRAVFWEILLQRHVLRQSRRRWLTHLLLFWAMVLLLPMHVFDDWITARLFTGYASTLNPFMFLRNLLGVLVLAGVIAAWHRRRSEPMLRRTTARADRWLLALLAALALSGAALEAVQIISEAMFDQMVVDYMGSDDPEEIAPLKAYWAARFDVAFGEPLTAAGPAALAAGRRVHEDYCAACHSRPASAVLAYPLALTLKPFAATLGRLDLETWLWYLHYLAGCLALALLPFSKLRHLFATPLGLMARALGPAATDRPVNRPTRRAMALDACTHCGVCSQHCSVAPIFEVIANPLILPSEKMGGLAAAVAGRKDAGARVALAEGSFICTACGRCTQCCPSGIDLQDLWAAGKSDLDRQGYPAPHGWMQRRAAAQWAKILKTDPAAAPKKDDPRRPDIRLADQRNTFWACVQCSTCTSVCPVVAMSDDPQRDLDLTPQQVMNLMRLQLKETAMGSRMVWNCVTCYKCQTHCPQGVRVADVLYELRNEACRRLTPLQAADPDVA